MFVTSFIRKIRWMEIFEFFFFLQLDEKPLTLMLELSMFSKSSGEMFGTLLTRSIKNRPTLLSAATLPDWNRLSSTIRQRRTNNYWISISPFSTLTSTSSIYASTVVSMSCILAAEPPTWDRSEVSPLVRLGARRVFCKRSTVNKTDRSVKDDTTNKKTNNFTITKNIVMPCFTTSTEIANITSILVHLCLWSVQSTH